MAAYAAGHHAESANPGQGGNVVISGHSNWQGEVFRTLERVAVGDAVEVVTADGRQYRYVVAEIYFRREVGVSLAEQLANGAFLEPTATERLTLVTCWPYGVDDHRLIVVAVPPPAAH